VLDAILNDECALFSSCKQTSSAPLIINLLDCAILENECGLTVAVRGFADSKSCFGRCACRYCTANAITTTRICKELKIINSLLTKRDTRAKQQVLFGHANQLGLGTVCDIGSLNGAAGQNKATKNNSK